jgi:hypothetical protein
VIPDDPDVRFVRVRLRLGERKTAPKSVERKGKPTGSFDDLESLSPSRTAPLRADFEDFTRAATERIFAAA